MNYDEFLIATIELGIAAAKRDYAKPEQAMKLEGSIMGFNACRGLKPFDLDKLRKKSFKTADVCMIRDDPEYWVYRCRYLEVEWVCNVVSAALEQVKLPIIVNPTAKGIETAMRILGSETLSV